MLTRMLVLISSAAQCGVAGVLAWHFLLRDRPDAVAAMLVAAFVLAGALAMRRLAHPLRRPGRSDPAVRFNLLLFVVLAAGSLLLIGIEQYQGADMDRLRFLAIIFSAVALPSLINGAALRWRMPATT